MGSQMAQVTVRLPSLLAKLVDGASDIHVEAETLKGALDELVRRYPALTVHLFDERGELRRHVLCFHNEENTRWFDCLDRPVRGGDLITFLQAVSGGAGDPP